MRKRPIKKIAGMWTIQLTPVDAKDFELKEGQEVDVEDMFVLRTIKNKKKK